MSEIFDIRWLAVLGCLSVAFISLVIMFRERNWAQKKYKQELKMTILQPDFITDLRRQLELDVQEHLKKAIKPLDKEIAEVVAAIKKQTETAITDSLKANATVLQDSAIEQAAAINEVIKADTKDLHDAMTSLQSEVETLQTETRQILDEYRQQVLARVKQMVDEQAADLLAEYLQSSLQGLELGDQQEFILQRLESNKAALLQELGDEK